MEGLTIVTDAHLQEIGLIVFNKAYERAKSEREYDQYLSTKQLSELFPYSSEWFRDKINAGLFGKKARNGDCMAKYKEVEKYLFGK